MTRWMDPPESVPRFSVNQRIQHGLAVAIGLALVITAVASVVTRSPASVASHRYAGMAACGFFAFHVAYLVLTGIRHDVSAEHVAFLPVGWEWECLQRGSWRDRPVGKYEPGEKGDYLAILLLSILLVGTGVALCWPSNLGIPGRAALGWTRTVHAAIAAAWLLHVCGNHAAARWFDAPPEFRKSVYTGKVPRRLAEKRPGWIAELERNRILIPVPREAVAEDEVQSRQVRDYLEEGNRLARDGRYAEASASFEEALRLFPDYSQARFNLGISRMKEGRNDLAEEQFRLFIASDPFNTMAIRAKELMDAIHRGSGGRGQP